MLHAFLGLTFLAVVQQASGQASNQASSQASSQATSQATFDAIQFNETNRILLVHNADDIETLRATLAVQLPSKQKASPCLPAYHRPDSECLEWLQSARFYLKRLPHEPHRDNTTCYSVAWQALSHDFYPMDCFDWSDSNIWYGGGYAADLTWPLNDGAIDFTPFVTGNSQKSQFGNVLTRYFVNSKGTAIIIDERTPLHIAIKKETKQICIQAKYDNFAYVNKLKEFPEMNYNICTSKDMKSLQTYLHNHEATLAWEDLKPEEMMTLDMLIKEPVWQIAPRFKYELLAETISNYSNDVIMLGFVKQGHVLINEYWQNEIGDLTVDTSRFETLESVVNMLHRRGFKVAFTIQPFVSTESNNFAECVQKRLFVGERGNDRRIPALTRFKSLASAGVLDITNNRTILWLTEKIQAVVDKYYIDSFYLDLGSAYDLPMYYQCEKQLTNPDQYKTIFTKTFENSLNIIGVSGAVSLPRPPIFVSLPAVKSTWEGLRSVIPTVLTYGISGYPFIMPGAVGGDLSSSKGLLESNATSIDTMPEVELYIRWLQLATFLPVIKFTHLPSKYKDDKVLEMAQNLTVLREKTITPLLLKYKREALEEGLPLIRPLWLVTGGDPQLVVKDEFAIGDDIVVAPVLYPGQTAREVFLPAGRWESGIDGSTHEGGRWVHTLVPTHRVAYFKRLLPVPV